MPLHMLRGKSSALGTGGGYEHSNLHPLFQTICWQERTSPTDDQRQWEDFQGCRQDHFRCEVPKAPWWGGVFERLIRSVKRCLKKILGLPRLTYDELFTALVEVELVLNSRPLTVVSADDLEEPLTPSHMIVGHRLRDAPDLQCPDLEEYEVDSDVVTNRARYLKRTIGQFWQRWRKEYLVGLRERHCYLRRKSHAPRIAIGDVVIIHDDLPRAMWKLGIVQELLVGADNEIRAAILQVSSRGRASTSCLRRPVQKLYPIEMTVKTAEDQRSSHPSEHVHDNFPSQTHEPDCNNPPPQRRSRRAAALAARNNL